MEMTATAGVRVVGIDGRGSVAGIAWAENLDGNAWMGAAIGMTEVTGMAIAGTAMVGTAIAGTAIAGMAVAGTAVADTLSYNLDMAAMWYVGFGCKTLVALLSPVYHR